MPTKIHGVRTGTIDSFTESGQRVKWVPTSEPVLVSGDYEQDDVADLPLRIAANPNSRQGFQEFKSRDKTKIRDSARLFAGFNVGAEEIWRPGQVYLMGYLLREAQLKTSKKIDPAFSFYVGLGAFPGKQVIASERSGQFIFINFGQSSDQFFESMFNLSADLAEWLHQESILLECQDGGKVVYMDYIESNPRKLVDVAEAKEYLEENKHRIKPSIWRMK